ncbi:MAG: cupredoxin domain-containing protein [Candidatus Nitrosocosmicus sp.]
MIKTSPIIIMLSLLTITMLAVTYLSSGNAANAVSGTNNPLIVSAGGGNGNIILDSFFPQNIQINSGQSVTWNNPTKVGEPHTVTFVMDNTTYSGVVSPLAVSNTTKFSPLPPGSNNAPILIPGKDGTNTIIAINARTFTPTVVDSTGNVKSFSPNAHYTFTGTEKYVNSGWLLSKGHEQEFPGSGNTFTATFEKPGTYKYQCILHPWMTGSVTVK